MPDVFISVVVPVYRAEQCLPALCRRLSSTLSAIHPDHEIILIDDRSPDGSWAVMQEIAREIPKITAVRLSRNFGQHYAIAAGLDLSQGQWTVIMDCDLQDPPEAIVRLLEKAAEGFDVVLARRAARKDNFFKRVISRIFYGAFALLSSYSIDPSVGSFRILSRSVVNALCGMRENFRLFGGMVHWVGFETGYVDVEHSARLAGKSSYDLRRMTKLALDGMIGFSNRPLYISIGIGITMSLLSGAYGAYVMVEYFLGGRIGIAGWSSLITVSAFIGGLVLLNLGLIGIYIGRIYDHTKGRPLYVIDKVISKTYTVPLLHRADPYR